MICITVSKSHYTKHCTCLIKGLTNASRSIIILRVFEVTKIIFFFKTVYHHPIYNSYLQISLYPILQQRFVVIMYAGRSMLNSSSRVYCGNQIS